MIRHSVVCRNMGHKFVPVRRFRSGAVLLKCKNCGRTTVRSDSGSKASYKAGFHGGMSKRRYREVFG